MEGHRNKVADSLADQSQNISKFTGKTNQEEPLRCRGGAWGANPLRASPRLVFPPQRGVPWAWAGHGVQLEGIPLGLDYWLLARLLARLLAIG